MPSRSPCLEGYRHSSTNPPRERFRSPAASACGIGGIHAAAKHHFSAFVECALGGSMLTADLDRCPDQTGELLKLKSQPSESP